MILHILSKHMLRYKQVIFKRWSAFIKELQICSHYLLDDPRTLLSPIKNHYMDRVKRIWYLSPMRAAKVQASLRIRAVSPEPSLLAHTSSESRGTFRQKARSLAPLNGWTCAVKTCHNRMLEDTNSLDRAHIRSNGSLRVFVLRNESFNNVMVW